MTHFVLSESRHELSAQLAADAPVVHVASTFDLFVASDREVVGTGRKAGSRDGRVQRTGRRSTGRCTMRARATQDDAVKAPVAVSRWQRVSVSEGGYFTAHFSRPH